jgi:hypothetical protein
MSRNYPNCLQMRDRLELTECHNSSKGWNSTLPPGPSTSTQILCPHTIPSVSSPEDSPGNCAFFFRRTSRRSTPSYPLLFFTSLMNCLQAFALVSYYSKLPSTILHTSYELSAGLCSGFILLAALERYYPPCLPHLF